MKKINLITIFLFCICLSTFGQKERSDIEEKYKWNLTDIYSSDASWEQAKESFILKVDKGDKFKGTITQSAGNLLETLEYWYNTVKEGRQLFCYASLNQNSDTRNMKYAGMVKEMQQIFADFSAKVSYIDPEILSSDWEIIEEYIKSEPKLKQYEKSLKDIFRLKEHILSEKEEKIMALSRTIVSDPYSIYYTFSNAEMPFSEVKLQSGEDIQLNDAAYHKYRASSNREDREIIFKTFWEDYEKFKASFGEMLYGNIKSEIFQSKARNYESTIEASLYPKGISVDVYYTHIENINNNLSTLHRYLKLRKRMMQLDTLEYFDLYAPVVKDVDLQYDYEEAKDIIIKAFQPLGEEYVKTVEKAFNERWIDVYPSKGKRSGAFSNGVFYEGHPYILVNYNGLYYDVATLAHELGHTMHSYFSNKTQPYSTANYVTFVAEVASTLNEVLLFEYLKSTIQDEDIKLSMLMSRLDDFRQTLYRQTQFAEFELKIHETAENGIPLTGDKLSDLYTEIVHKYYGHEEGVCYVNDYINMEWAFIPHFYYSFYVYQYSTSFVASNALIANLLNGDKDAMKNYFTFLSSGGSDYPIELLKKAGVDLTKSEAFEQTIKLMNAIMDEIEAILDKKGM